jgi:hypothetical protein
MPYRDAMTLSDLATTTLTIACAPCVRRGVYSVAKLRAKHGDARLTDLRVFLSADCPKRASARIQDQCRAIYERLEYRRE